MQYNSFQLHIQLREGLNNRSYVRWAASNQTKTPVSGRWENASQFRVIRKLELIAKKG